MKKKLLIMLVFLLAAFIGLTNALAENYNVSVYVNGKFVDFPDQKPYIDDYTGVTLVPLRFVSEALNIGVNWDSNKQKVFINGDNIRVTLDIGSPFAEINGVSMLLEGDSLLVNGRAMVPLRFVSETLGANVEWTSEYGGGRVDIMPGETKVFPERKYGLIRRIYDDSAGNAYLELDYMELYFGDRAYEEANKDGEQIDNDVYGRDSDHATTSLRILPDAGVYILRPPNGYTSLTTKKVTIQEFINAINNWSPYYVEIVNGAVVKIKEIYTP